VIRNKHRIREFDYRVLRKIFGHKRDEVTGKWRRLHDDDLHDLYFSSNIIRVIKSRGMRWARYVARMGGKPNTEFFLSKPERRRDLGGHRPRGSIILKMDGTVIRQKGIDWIYLAQDRH
jgi:hypothetical protein